MEDGTYIRIYGDTKAPHLLPKFFSGILVLQEIAYQMVILEVGAVFYREKKSI
jgi:hypothetical protein